MTLVVFKWSGCLIAIFLISWKIYSVSFLKLANSSWLYRQVILWLGMPLLKLLRDSLRFGILFVACDLVVTIFFCSFLTTSVLRNLHHLSAPSKHQFMQCAGGHLSHLQIDLWKEDVWSSAPWIARILPHHWGELNYQAGNARLIAVRCLQLLLYIICLPLLAKQIIVRSFDIF